MSTTGPTGASAASATATSRRCAPPATTAPSAAHRRVGSRLP
jgi:hypothetical protein